MTRQERLAKQAEDHARANRRHVDDEPVTVVKASSELAEDSSASFTKAFPAATEEELPSREAAELKRQKNLKDNEPEKLTAEEWEAVKGGKAPKSNLTQDQLSEVFGPTKRAKGQGPDGEKTAALERGQDFFNDKAGETFAFLAKYVHYRIPLDDGTDLFVYRVKPPKYEIEEFKDMLARFMSGTNMKGELFKNAWEGREFETLIEDKKVRMFLREAGTDAIISRADILHAVDSTFPDAIVETALSCTLSRWVEGKKLEMITNLA